MQRTTGQTTVGRTGRHHRRRLAVGAALMAGLLAAGSPALASAAGGTPASPHAPGSVPPGIQWVPGVGLRPAASDLGGLSAVTSVSSTDVWAVGYSFGTPFGTLAKHWDGKTWTTVSTPNVKGATITALTGVDAVSTDDVWAVGVSGAGSEGATVAEHWNGHAWSLVPTPNPKGFDLASLSAVSALSADDVWAVGYSSVVGGVERTLVEHWDGTKWRIVASPNPDGIDYVTMWGVTAVSPHDVWAVGNADDLATTKTLVEHWDGHSWKLVDSPNRGGDFFSSNLTSVDARSATDIWATGSSFDGVSKTLVLHWDGHNWKLVASPNPHGAEATSLYGVSAVSAKSAWAVGLWSDGTLNRTWVEHWDGTSWRRVASPNQKGADLSALYAISTISPNDTWAVGSTTTGSTQGTLLEHWNGKKWAMS